MMNHTRLGPVTEVAKLVVKLVVEYVEHLYLAGGV